MVYLCIYLVSQFQTEQQIRIDELDNKLNGRMDKMDNSVKSLTLNTDKKTTLKKPPKTKAWRLVQNFATANAQNDAQDLPAYLLDRERKIRQKPFTLKKHNENDFSLGQGSDKT